MLQDERTLQVTGAVQPGRETEVSFEQRTDSAKSIEDGIGSHKCHHTFI